MYCSPSRSQDDCWSVATIATLHRHPEKAATKAALTSHYLNNVDGKHEERLKDTVTHKQCRVIVPTLG